MAERVGRSPLALFAMAVALLLPVAYSTALLGGYWTLRAALVPVIAGVGLVQLALVAVAGTPPSRRGARAAAAFLVIALISSLLSRNHTVAFFGLYDWGTGLIFIAGLAGAWAIGASLPPRQVRPVGMALMAGIGINVVAALAEMVVDLRRFGLGLYQHRAPGLLGNPIQLGTLVAAGIALAAFRAHEHPWRWAFAIAVMAASLEVSGSRLGVAVAAVVTVALLWKRRWRIAAFVVLALVLGFGLGAALGAVGGGATATTRVQNSTTAGGLLGGRAATWWSARYAVANRPLFGIGPGQFRSATSAHHPLSVAKTEGFDVLFADAHNIAVEYAVTTGLVGLAALAVWLGLAVAAGSGPLLAFSLAALACHLLEPQYAGVTPLLFLALGAAAVRDSPTHTVGTERGGARRAASLASAVLALAGAAAGAALIVGDHWLQSAGLDFTENQAKAAERVLPHWAQPLIELAHIYEFDAAAHLKDRPYPALVLRTRMEAIRRDPTDPFLWNLLGGDQVRYGRWDDASKAYAQALLFDPWSITAMNGLGTAACELGAGDQAHAWFDRSLALKPDQADIRRALSFSCPPPPS